MLYLLSFIEISLAIFSNNTYFQIDWGEASMIQAERVLLQNALEDPLNDRFVFLSDR